MGTLEDFEMGLIETGRYDSYNAGIVKADSLRRSDRFDQARYMAAVAHKANMEGATTQTAFIGGLGLLVHLVAALPAKSTESVINGWRGTRDLDVIVKHPGYEYIIEQAFDGLDFSGKSHSIPNKKTVRGYSKDLEGRGLSATSADVYIPKDQRQEVIEIHGKKIGPENFERTHIAHFYGLPIQVLDPIDLMDMKCRVSTSNRLPRAQDCEDIIHLASLAERFGYAPDKVSRYLSADSKDSLRKVFERLHSDKGANLISNLLLDTPTVKYQEALVK